MAKNLVIVESPAKAKTIEGYLGKDFVVKSSFGHVRDLAKKEAIDIENDFAPRYEVSADKKQIVSELRKLVKESDTIWLATDEDREGEAISWHLYETLGLDKKDTKRIAFNEITRSAILKAIDSPREINKKLVDAQQARRILDRLVGFELSPVLWRKVRPSLSAGRVQSVAVKLIVEKEKEIEKFESDSFHKVSGVFTTGKGTIKAEVSRQLKGEEEVLAFLDATNGAQFSVESVTMKPGVKKPVAPFITSTLQQEASLKLGFTVSRTMSVAQRLYESGHITYMRTDSVNLSETALNAAEEEIKKSYGSAYSNRTNYVTKGTGAQEAHEAIRPTNFSNNTITADSDEERLYDLIWKRAISSQMSDAQLERTTIKLSASGVSEFFQANGEVIKFDGFLKVYLESKIDEDPDDDFGKGILPAVVEGDKVDQEEIKVTQRFTRPPSRYAEASLVKKLESLGIGRPSTYAPTITTIQKRGYIEKPNREGTERKYNQWTQSNGSVEKVVLSEITGREKNKLSPTDIGIVVTDFLSTHFERIMDYNFTAQVEKEFDEIAKGVVQWPNMLKEFYIPFHTSVEDTLENSERATGERELGTHPESNRRVIARIGRFGPMIQVGDEKLDGEKPQFASLRKNQSINSITLEEALELFKLPRTLGEYEGSPIKANVGRFGPYVQQGSLFASLPEEDDPMTVNLDRAIELIILKKEEDAKRIIKKFPENEEVLLLHGRWGPFLKIGKKNYKLPKDAEPEKLTLEECITISENQPAPKRKQAKKKKK